MPHTRSGARRFLPASVLALRGYTRRLFLSDLIAGVTVGLVALPLAMAFAISSGMSPQAGIYCAVVTGFIISGPGGSTRAGRRGLLRPYRWTLAAAGNELTLNMPEGTPALNPAATCSFLGVVRSHPTVSFRCSWCCGWRTMTATSPIPLNARSR